MRPPLTKVSSVDETISSRLTPSWWIAYCIDSASTFSLRITVRLLLTLRAHNSTVTRVWRVSPGAVSSLSTKLTSGSCTGNADHSQAATTVLDGSCEHPRSFPGPCRCLYLPCNSSLPSYSVLGAMPSVVGVLADEQDLTFEMMPRHLMRRGAPPVCQGPCARSYGPLQKYKVAKIRARSTRSYGWSYVSRWRKPHRTRPDAWPDAYLNQ